MNRNGAALLWMTTVSAVPAAVPPEAHASENHDECRTRTSRVSGLGLSTVVGLDGKPRVAVDILRGETLCLAAIENGAPRLVASSPLSKAIELRLDGDRDTTTLTVRHQNYSREIEYTVGYPLAGRNDIFVSKRNSAPPGAPHTYGWLGRTGRVVLFDFASVPRAEYASVDYEPGFLALSFVSAFHFAPVDDLNAEFERNGFSSVSGLQPYLGLGADASLRGFRANLDFTGGIHRAGDDRSPNVNQALIALGLGYTVYRHQGIELFPMLGLSIGDIGVDVRSDDPALAFEGLVAGEQRIRKNLSLLLFSFGADFRHEFWPKHDGGLIAGLRAGYGYQFWSGDWLQDESAAPDLRGGPEIDTSGPFVRLAFGVYAH